MAVDHGIDVRRAREIVGTSSGAIAGSMIALAFDAYDLAALVAGADDFLGEDSRLLGARFRADLPATPPLPRMLRWQSPQSVLASCLDLCRGNMRAVVLRLLREGSFDLREHLAFLAERQWRDVRIPITICTAHARSGHRLTWTADGGSTLIDAVMASCTLPGIMSPIAIGGVPVVDGGVASPTSSDLLAGKGRPDLVLVVSPMSASGARTPAGRMTARFSQAALSRELRMYDADQTVVVVEADGALGHDIVDDPLHAPAPLELMRSTFLAAGLAA
jgi:NTE family protein